LELRQNAGVFADVPEWQLQLARYRAKYFQNLKLNSQTRLNQAETKL